MTYADNDAPSARLNFYDHDAEMELGPEMSESIGHEEFTRQMGVDESLEKRPNQAPRAPSARPATSKGRRTPLANQPNDRDDMRFDSANLSPEITQLFEYITAYEPQEIEIEPMLAPFIPEYIPAIGEIDAFIKIPRPDDVKDDLGLIVLDEPAARQSDPTVVGMQMRASSGHASSSADQRNLVVKRLERGDKNGKEIEQWIENIRDLHKCRPPPTVVYSKKMPDLETLMAEWPPEIEEMLRVTSLPSADLDIPLEEYVDIVCSLFDIPVHPNTRIQSLHRLFTLYIEFKNSGRYRELANQNAIDSQAERLEF